MALQVVNNQTALGANRSIHQYPPPDLIQNIVPKDVNKQNSQYSTRYTIKCDTNFLFLSGYNNSMHFSCVKKSYFLTFSSYLKRITQHKVLLAPSSHFILTAVLGKFCVKIHRDYLFTTRNSYTIRAENSLVFAIKT